MIIKGCHGTGKIGNLDVHFSRQGEHREFAKIYSKYEFTQGIYPQHREYFEVLKIKWICDEMYVQSFDKWSNFWIKGEPDNRISFCSRLHYICKEGILTNKYYILRPKNTGKKQNIQGNLRENTGNFFLIGVWQPCNTQIDFWNKLSQMLR